MKNRGPAAVFYVTACVAGSRILIFAHDLFRKPVPTLRDHAAAAI
jgi:hypothetical protein